ncbi:MmgE/PrpD family protein [Rhodophyticola sp. CCM32]|uniref:MmgE/PrpD family protein n=1 Tax=Rhodophyticola sp. CCM32 TaxID=2916397 RepID=UPI002367AC74|nr:MmgE/PrpD family protein [Rhodophyticola sp. CCM32]
MLQYFDKISGFALTRSWAEMPASALSTAASLLLDTVGVAAAAGPMQAGVIARETAMALYGSAERRFAAQMMFDGRMVSVAGAGYAAATQIDNLDAHDGYNPCKGHIGVAVIPALSALMQGVPDMSGPEALAHLVVGYEIAGRAGKALHGTVSDYHTSGAWNALGVAAMAARIRNHDAAMLQHGLGIAEYHGPRSQMMREIASPTMLHDGSGWGVLVGLSAAVLAEKGFTGAPAITVEQAPEYWEDLGQNWLIEDQYIKPYPICRWAHGAIDAARDLVRAHGLTPADIAHVQVNSFAEAAALFPGLPQTSSQAQYSLPFALAAFLAHGRITLEQIEGAGLINPDTIAMHGRIDVASTPRHDARFPANRMADVIITTTDGRSLASGDTHARGDPQRPLNQSAFAEKFADLAGPALGTLRSQALANTILGLTDPLSRLSDLASLLLDPPEPA